MVGQLVLCRCATEYGIAKYKKNKFLIVSRTATDGLG